jgi:hypothetical protein
MHHSRRREKETPIYIPKDQAKITNLRTTRLSQKKKGIGKTKKDISKWCDFDKSRWHNTDECHTKQSLVVEMKAP